METMLDRGVWFCLIIHHTDARREWSYDRDFSVDKLDKAPAQAASNNWTVVDMKQDRKKIYP